jgi:hypothetical protein
MSALRIALRSRLGRALYSRSEGERERTAACLVALAGEGGKWAMWKEEGGAVIVGVWNLREVCLTW